MVRLLLVGVEGCIENWLHKETEYKIESRESKAFDNGIATHDIDYAILELKKLDERDLSLLRHLRKELSVRVPILVLAPCPKAETAVNIMKLGASSYIWKNLSRTSLIHQIQQELRDIKKNNDNFSFAISKIDVLQGRFVFASEPMKRLNYEICRCAKFARTILLVGESGVGKDKIAREIHERSNRKNKPFIIVPVNALNEGVLESELFGHEKGAFSGAEKTKVGKFEAANGGTLYLPEISELPEAVQLKLLNFLQYRTTSRVGQDPRQPELKIDIMLIMATNANLERCIKQGKMRKDFYHRINVMKLDVLPLRKRLDDIVPLTEYFVQKYAMEFFGRQVDIDPGAFETLKRYNWPGNVRELENFVEGTLIYAGDTIINTEGPVAITGEQFSEFIGDRQTNGAADGLSDYRSAERIFKEQYFRELLNRTKGNIKQAAEFAQLTPQGLRKTLNHLGISI